ncbi:MAG: S8 family serine peptidase, partial [Verrucomicrobia bacterium]|nr:S8 family serine peptidase [Verrucomicrobiota bacterium]
MNKFRKRLWTYTLCMGIVMTAVISWYYGGPSHLSIQTRVAFVSSNEPAETQAVLVPQIEAKKPDRPALADTPRAFHPVSLNLYQERLLKDAVMLDRRQIQARGKEPAKEIRLWRTDFKYPLVREETTLGMDADGRLQPVRREFSVADHAMVKFPVGVRPQQVTDWTKKHGFTLRHALKTTAVTLIAVAEESLDTADRIMTAFRQAFPQTPEQVAVAERDYLVFPTLLPDDTSFSQLWGMHNTGQTGGTVDADIDAVEAWDLTTGSREVLVGVIDTGVDRTHPDLVSNMWRNPKEIAGNRVDDDRNGFIDDADGWDFFADDNDPMDENNHGTHCSGTIGGVGNNRSGVTGVCWQISIVGIRFLGPSGGVTSDAIDSVNYSRTLGVDLTSNSWGGGGFSSLLQAAIVNAGQANQLFIAAAGNDGSDLDLSPQYPASYAADNIVSVAASTDRDARSSFSNYGRTNVDLAAPGSSILSTVRNGGYSTFSGTSMATPHVAGAVALLKSLAPTMPLAEIKTQLLETVDPLPAFTSTTVSGGRLNVARLIADSAGPRPIISVTTIEEQAGGNRDGISNPGEALALRFTVQNRGTELAQNVKATLTSSSKASRYTITRGSVDLGNLVAGQLLESATPFLVQSRALTLTPYAEEFQITLRYGPEQKESVHRLTLYLYTSSRIAGRVTRVSDNSPISGATVSFDGPTNRTIDTGSDGRYSATLTDGVYQIRASASGFVPSLAVTKNAPPGAEGVDFSLGIPRLQLSPTAVQAELYVNRKESQVVEMINEGTAALTWNLKTNNRSTNTATAQNLYRLPEAPIKQGSKALEEGSRSSFKTMETNLAPALELPLDSLSGRTIGAFSTIWDRSLLLRDLQSRGAAVVTLSSPLTSADLAAVDAIIVDDAIGSFTDNELELLRARIVAGAGVLCEADNPSSMQRINELFESTGIQARSDPFRDLFLTDIRPHPMTAGVRELREFAVGASATITGLAEVLVQDPNGRAHAAITRLGAGFMVFVGNEISDSSNFESGDARRVVNQIMDGLVGQVSWLQTSVSSGFIRPGERYRLALDFSAVGQAAGTYEAEAIFQTNIPNEVDQRLPITMIVSDAPEIVGSVDRIDFGSVVEGVSAQQTLTLSNAGTLPLNVQRMSLAGPDAGYFSLQTQAPFQVSAKANHFVVVSFDPTAPIRRHEAQLLIESNDPTLPAMVVPILAVRQLAPTLSIKAKEVRLQLREGQKGSAEVTLENRGKGPLSWRMSLISQPPWVTLAGGLGRIFSNAKGSSRLDFDTNLLKAGDYETTLEIVTNDLVSPVSFLPVRLRIIAAPRIVLSQNVFFADTLIGQHSQISVPIMNLGSADLVINSIHSFAPSFSCLSVLPFRVLPGQMRSLIIRFRPTKVGGAGGSLILGTNLPERFSFLVVSGTGIRGPVLQSNPASLSFSTAPGVALQRQIVLTNQGDLTLRWRGLLGDGSRFTLDNSEGTLSPGSSQAITLKTITNLLPAGVYSERLILESNDARRPIVAIPIRMQVTRTGTLALSKPTIDFPESRNDAVAQQQVIFSNTGNVPFDILSAVPSSSRLTLDIVLPLQLGPGDSVPVTFSYSSSVTGDFKDDCKFTTSIRSNRVVTLPVSAKVVRPPLMAVTPSRLDERLDPGELISRDITIRNDGGAELAWTSSLIDGFGPEVPLAEVLSQFNANMVLLQTKIPSTYAFPRGVFGDRIIEPAGSGIFNGGNIHTTNTALGATIPYSDKVLTTHVGVGASGSYFTSKAGTLFLFAADLDQMSSFSIQGQLATGGAGRVDASSITRTIAGKTYRGFLKQTHGLSQPAVHHLVIVTDKPGINQSVPIDTTLDELEITGLSGKTRLYHLLFCTLSGRQVTEAEVTRLMDSFLLSVVHPLSPEWLKLTPTTGTVRAERTRVQALQLDTRMLPGGTYGATVRFNSNAVGLSQIDLPVTVTVPSRFLLRSQPDPFVFPDTYAYAQRYQACQITNVGNLPVTLTAINS